MDSTSVPALIRQPIIDLTIAIVPGSWACASAWAAPVGTGDQGISGREVFKPIDGQRSAALPVHHLYVCQRDACELRKMLAYRDTMRAHPEWRERLSDWKWRLAEALQNDRQAYIDGKDAMMREVMRYAGAEAGAAEAGVAPEPGEELRPDEIAAFLEGYPPPVPEMASSLRGMVRRVLPHIQESLDAASRIIAYGLRPRIQRHLCTLIPARPASWGSGASLPDPEDLLRRARCIGLSHSRIRPISIRTGPARRRCWSRRWSFGKTISHDIRRCVYCVCYLISTLPGWVKADERSRVIGRGASTRSVSPCCSGGDPLLALGLRVWQLDEHVLWWDEGNNAYFAPDPCRAA